MRGRQCCCAKSTCSYAGVPVQQLRVDKEPPRYTPKRAWRGVPQTVPPPFSAASMRASRRCTMRATCGGSGSRVPPTMAGVIWAPPAAAAAGGGARRCCQQHDQQHCERAETHAHPAAAPAPDSSPPHRSCLCPGLAGAVWKGARNSPPALRGLRKLLHLAQVCMGMQDGLQRPRTPPQVAPTWWPRPPV